MSTIVKTRYGPHLLLAILLVIPLLFATRLPNIDFNKAYYPVGKSILDTGTFTYTHEGFKNMPVVGLLLVPFAIGGRGAGAVRFLVFELLCFLAAFCVAERVFVRTAGERWILLGLFVLSMGFVNSILFGQLTVAAFLLYLLMLAAWLDGRRATSGALLAGLFLLKIPPGLLLLYFAVKRETRVVLSAVVAYLAFFLLSVAVFGPALNLQYLRSALLINEGRTQVAYNNQNIFAFVMRFLRHPTPFDWRMVDIPGPLSLLLPAAVVLAIGSLLLLIARKGKPGGSEPRPGLELEVSMVTCLFLMIFPVSWDHYYIFLVVPFLIAWKRLRGSLPRAFAPVYGASFVMANFPVLPVLLKKPMIPGTLLTAIMSLPFLGCALLLLLLASGYRSAAKGGGHDSIEARGTIQ